MKLPAASTSPKVPKDFVLSSSSEIQSGWAELHCAVHSVTFHVVATAPIHEKIILQLQESLQF